MAIKLTTNTPQQQALPSAAFGVPGSIKQAGSGFEKLSEFASDIVEARQEYQQNKRESEIDVSVSNGLSQYRVDLQTYKDLSDAPTFDAKAVTAAEDKLMSWGNVETWLGPDATQKYTDQDFFQNEKYRTWRESYPKDVLAAQNNFNSKIRTNQSVKDVNQLGYQLERTTDIRNLSENVNLLTNNLQSGKYYAGNEEASNTEWTQSVSLTFNSTIRNARTPQDLEVISSELDLLERNPNFVNIVDQGTRNTIRNNIIARENKLKQTPEKNKGVTETLDAIPYVRTDTATDDEIMGEALKLGEFSTSDFSHLKGATNYANLELEQEQSAEFIKLLEPVRLDVGPELPRYGHSVLFDATLRYYGRTASNVYNSQDVTSVLDSLGFKDHQKTFGNYYKQIEGYVSRVQGMANDAKQFNSVQTLIAHTSPDTVFLINQAQIEAQKALNGLPYDESVINAARGSYRKAYDDIDDYVVGVDPKLALDSLLIFPEGNDIKKASNLPVKDQLDWIKVVKTLNSPESVSNFFHYMSRERSGEGSASAAALLIGLNFSGQNEQLAEELLTIATKIPDASERAGKDYLQYKSRIQNQEFGGWYENTIGVFADYYDDLGSTYLGSSFRELAEGFEFSMYQSSTTGNDKAINALNSTADTVSSVMGLPIKSDVHDEIFVVPPEALYYPEGHTNQGEPTVQVKGMFSPSNPFSRIFHPRDVSTFRGAPQQEYVRMYETAQTTNLASAFSEYVKSGSFISTDQLEHLSQYIPDDQKRELTNLLTQVIEGEADVLRIREGIRSLRNKDGEQLIRGRQIGDVTVMYIKPGLNLQHVPFTYLDANGQYTGVKVPTKKIVDDTMGMLGKRYTLREDGFIGQFVDGDFLTLPFQQTIGLLDSLYRVTGINDDSSLQSDFLLDLYYGEIDTTIPRGQPPYGVGPIQRFPKEK
jgi:hypothetical protein